jgi:hypothetical protein
MANINSKTEARKRVREAQSEANKAHIERERENVDDAASLLVELGRLAGVDRWEQNRILEVRGMFVAWPLASQPRYRYLAATTCGARCWDWTPECHGEQPAPDRLARHT